MANELALSIAAQVRAELSRQMKPQRELVELLGLSQAQISERVRGDVEWRISELTLVAAVLGVPITNFLPAGTETVGSAA
jgi:transcriptional regulator with XRE-family HTH domain